MQFTLIETGWGLFGFVARDRRIVATMLPHGEHAIRDWLHSRFPAAKEVPSLLPGFCRQVRDYFAGKPSRFDVRIDLADHPPFRQAVLEACRRIPFGKTASYSDLARAVGNPAAARAVGGAMAHNPLPLVVPCHRVLRADGSIGGFSSPQGIREKQRLLRLEGIVSFGRAA